MFDLSKYFGRLYGGNGVTLSAPLCVSDEIRCVLLLRGGLWRLVFAEGLPGEVVLKGKVEANSLHVAVTGATMRAFIQAAYAIWLCTNAA